MIINKVKKYFTIAIIIIITGCSKEMNIQPLSKSSVIVAFGDSLTYGYGAKYSSDSYPKQLESITGYTVINAGLNGDTAENGKNRIQSVIEEHAPDLVILSLGGNDMLRGQYKNLESNLSIIVKYLLKENIQVVLLAEPRPNINFMIAGLSDDSVYEKVAESYNIPLISGVFSKYLSNNQYKSDTIHLNTEGYGLVANDVADELKSIGIIKY